MNDSNLTAFLRDSGAVSPVGCGPGLVDLSRGVAHLCGVEGLERGPDVVQVERLVGSAEHYVLILVDGLGGELLDRLPANGFLRTHVGAELRSVFPSTTAAALTSLATGEWPGRHGVLGWWMYLVDPGISITSLLFEERFERRPLDQMGIGPEKVFTVPSLIGRFCHAPLMLVPESVAGTPYSRYWSGNTASEGYKDVRDGIMRVLARVDSARGPTFSYLYLPQIDSLCHEKGPDAPEVTAALASLDSGLAMACAHLAGRARIVITGDHGLVSVAAQDRFVLADGDPLLACLVCPPVGDPRAPVFHVQDGCEGRFAEMFDARAGAGFLLASAEEAAAAGLYGPEGLSPVSRGRLGTFVGLPRGAGTVDYHRAGTERHPHRGDHGGLAREEMVVPLIVA